MINYLDDIKSPLLNRITRMSERELHRIYEPECGLFIAESPNVIMRALEAGYEPVELLVDSGSIDGSSGAPAYEELIERIVVKKVPVYALPSAEISKIRGFEMTRGALCLFRRREHDKALDIIAGARRIAVLEDVMNPTNLGAIFRSAAALYIDAILLTRGCSDPLYKRASRVSMGTVFQVPWTYIESSADGLELLNNRGYTSVAMALDDRAIKLGTEGLKGIEKLAVFLGSEGYGLKDETISRCDKTVMIPMSNEVDSLNVAAAAAVTFWELR